MSSPPLGDDYSPSGSQDRLDNENSYDERSYKRRRLAADSDPPSNMADRPRYSNMPVPPPNQFTPYYQYGPSSSNLPQVFMNSQSLWEEAAALEYLASGSGFSQDLRNLVQPPSTFSNVPAVPPEVRPPRSSELSIPPTQVQAPPQHAAPAGMPTVFRALRDDVFRHFAGMSEERLRELEVHLVESPRVWMVNEAGRSAYVNHEHMATTHPTNPAARPPTVQGRPATMTTPASGKPATMLILSRATTKSIEALDEHKKECPACQLDFEPDNFMALITCCGTAMHATCLSAWVNSQTYSKSRTCMKCRRAIDARRVLNNVVPPVSDKSWDEGADLNTPESLKGDARIEINVSARPDRSAYRRMRGSMYLSNYRARSLPHGLPDDMRDVTRQSITRLQEQQMSEFEDMKQQLQAAFEATNKALKEDFVANRKLCEAQAQVNSGVLTDLGPFAQQCEAAAQEKEKTTLLLRKSQRDMEALRRSHAQRMSSLLEEAWPDRSRARDDEAAVRAMLTAASGDNGVPPATAASPREAEHR